jgi:V-type H+-transporting ATPase 16kDa proteolipid subunit
VVMSGIIAVYGLVVSVLIAGGRKSFGIWHVVCIDIFVVDPRNEYSLYAGFIHLAAGLACGMTGLAAGYAIGIVGDSVGTDFYTVYSGFMTDVCSVYGHTLTNQKSSWPWCLS